MKAHVAFLSLGLLVTADLAADQPSRKPPPSQPDVPSSPAGQVPAGETLTAADVASAVDGDYTGQTVYLVGNFVVTARGKDRAVLRFVDNVGPTIRIVAAYPPTSPMPKEGVKFTRDSTCGFLITEIRRSRNGEVSIYVRDILPPGMPARTLQ